MAHARAVTWDVSSDVLTRWFSCCSLTEFPACSVVSHEWHDAATISFAGQLQWRGLPVLLRLSLGAPTPGNRIMRSCGMATFTSGDHSSVVALLADPDYDAVRAFHCFGDQEAVVEGPVRQWDYAMICGGFSGSLVGYKDPSQHGADTMAYFPALTQAGVTSDIVRELPSRSVYQNILQAGDQLFLPRQSRDWWTDRTLPTDVLHIPTGRWLCLDIAPFRDALKTHLVGAQGDGGMAMWRRVKLQAVSATKSHFVYRVHTREGRAVVGSLLVPDASNGSVELQVALEAKWGRTGGASGGGSSASTPLHFVTSSFEASHPLCCELNHGRCSESHKGDDLLLYADREGPASAPGQDGVGGLWLCVVSGRTAACHSVRLQPPSLARPSAHRWEVSALTICRAGGVACGCSHDLDGQMQWQSWQDAMPRIEVWDLRSGMHITSISLVNAAGPLAERPLYGVGGIGEPFKLTTQVEVKTITGRRTGTGTSNTDPEAGEPDGSGADSQSRRSIMVAMWAPDTPQGELFLTRIPPGTQAPAS